MTRAKEITKEAKKFAKEIDDWEIAEDVQDAFEQGARWADEHPINYDGKAALYFNNIVYENGYKEAVDKACDWLHSTLYLDYERSIEHRFASLEDLMNDFRKSMKRD